MPRFVIVSLALLSLGVAGLSIAHPTHLQNKGVQQIATQAAAATVSPVQAGYILLQRDQALSWFNPQTLDERAVISFDKVGPPGFKISRVKNDPAQNNAYVMLWKDNPDVMQIAQVDLHTNSVRTIFQDNVHWISIEIAPDGQHIAIYEIVSDYRELPMLHCILNVKTNECVAAPKDMFVFQPYIWADAHTLLSRGKISGANTRVYALNADTMSPKPLSVLDNTEIDAITMVPNTHLIFVAYYNNNTASADFLTVDLDTQEVKSPVVKLAPNGRSYFDIAFLQFSPDGKFLMYSDNGTIVIQSVLEGYVLRRITNTYMARWFPDSSGVVGIRSIDGDHNSLYTFTVSHGDLKELIQNESSTDVAL